MSLTIIRKVSVTGGTVLRASNNLGDVANAATAFANIKQAASTSATGVVQLAASADAETDNANALTIAEFLRRLGPYRNALAPAQALAFDGTAPSIGTLSAFGANGYSIAVQFNFPSLATDHGIFDGSGLLFIVVRSSGRIDIYDRVGSAYLLQTSAGLVTAGTTYNLQVVRGGAFLNAVSIGTYTDNSTYTGTAYKLGSDFIGTILATGTIRLIGIYNRTLIAAEVLALYQEGAPRASDFNNASNTSLVTGDNSTFASDTGYWSKGGTATINSAVAGKARLAAANDYLARGNFFTKPGLRYRVRITLSNNTGNVYVYNGATVWSAFTGNGTFEAEFVATPIGGSTGLYILATAAADVDDFTIYPLGLLCAPDANQPGAGPQWRAAPGTTAAINLPGDGVTGGVTWALPGGTAADFGETRTASGYSLGRDAVVIPEGYRIARIWCSGDGTFSLGNAASGTEVVNAFTAAATTQPATLAAYTTATRKLYVTLGTATTVTYSVHLERI